MWCACVYARVQAIRFQTSVVSDYHNFVIYDFCGTLGGKSFVFCGDSGVMKTMAECHEFLKALWW